MLGASLLHLDLRLAVLRVDIIEEALARLARVELHLRIEIFVDVNKHLRLRQLQAEVVEASGLVIGGDALGGLLQGGSLQEHHATEVEIVAQTALLVIDGGRLQSATVGRQLIVVGVEHAGTRHLGHVHHALQGKVTQLDELAVQVNERVGGGGLGGDGLPCGALGHGRRKEIHFVHNVLLQALLVALIFLLRAARQETVYQMVHKNQFCFSGCVIFIPCKSTQNNR